jgi:hypothetical protein
MPRVRFHAFGHQNVVGVHSTTLEITAERRLTRRGTCIIGVNSTMTLNDLDEGLKALAAMATTRIVLRMSAGGLTEVVSGWGSSGLNYSDTRSMVVRTSSFECDRTVMVRADKAASGLGRSFVEQLKSPEAILECELVFARAP